MAITRAQQVKQMLQDGGRIGFFTAGLARGDEISPGTASKQEGNGPTRRDQDLRDLATKQAEDKKEELVEKFRNKQMQDSNLPGLLGMATKFLKKPLQAGMTGTRNFVLNKVIDAKRGMFKDIDFYSLTPKEQENLMDEYMSARMDNTIDAYGNQIGGGGRDDNEIFIPQGIMTAQASGSMDQETDTDTETEDQDERFLAFRADGGRIGFFKGAVAGGGNISPGTDVKGNVRDDNPFTGGRPDDSGPSAPPPSVINPPPKEPFLKTRNVLEGYKQHNINNQKLKNAVTLGLISNDEYNILGGYDVNQTMGLNPFMTGVTSGLYNVYQTIKGDQPASEIYGDVKRNVEGSFGLPEELQTKYDNIMAMSSQEMTDQLADQKVAQMAEGGMPYEGGIMDLESARQMYGLGKLVKKATRAVKKIAKSPIGKAALLYAGGSYLTGAGNFFGGLKGAGALSKAKLFGLPSVPNVPDFVSGGGTMGILGKLGLTAGGGSLMPTALGGIAAASALAGLLTAEQEEEAQELSRGEGIDIEAARQSILARAQGNIGGDLRMLSARASGGRIGYQEGSKEPVAKKTMPLLDMGGQEMDLRAEGGFVPIGRMEKADDVPARLSKNEFVFTADAVRNAGDGDVDKCAEVMYNMMKNLEAGGDVSEESQGLEGARKMFQTSQRLEEVL